MSNDRVMNDDEIANRMYNCSALIGEKSVIFDVSDYEVYTYIPGNIYLEAFGNAWHMDPEDRYDADAIVLRFKGAILATENNSSVGILEENINITVINYNL